MSTAPPVLTFTPLEQHAVAWLAPRGHLHDNGGPCVTRALADLFHVERATIHRWRRTDRLPLDQADRLAIELGRHLTELWTDDEIEFAFVWATVNPEPMRQRRAAAYRAACELRAEAVAA